MIWVLSRINITEPLVDQRRVPKHGGYDWIGVHNNWDAARRAFNEIDLDYMDVLTLIEIDPFAPAYKPLLVRYGTRVIAEWMAR